MFDQVHNNNRGQTLLTDQTSGIPPTGRRHFAFPLVRSVIREPCDINFFLLIFTLFEAKECVDF